MSRRVMLKTPRTAQARHLSRPHRGRRGLPQDEADRDAETAEEVGSPVFQSPAAPPQAAVDGGDPSEPVVWRPLRRAGQKVEASWRPLSLGPRTQPTVARDAWIPLSWLAKGSTLEGHGAA